METAEGYIPTPEDLQDWYECLKAAEAEERAMDEAREKWRAAYRKARTLKPGSDLAITWAGNWTGRPYITINQGKAAAWLRLAGQARRGEQGWNDRRLEAARDLVRYSRELRAMEKQAA